MRLAAAILLACAALSAACKPLASDAKIQRLVACADELERTFAADPATRFAKIAGGQFMCASEAFADCGDLGTFSELDEQAERTRVPRIAIACTRAHCDRLGPSLALCAGLDVLVGTDEAAAREAAAEFIAHKLARDLGLDRADPRISAMAAAFARLWAVETMRAGF